MDTRKDCTYGSPRHDAPSNTNSASQEAMPMFASGLFSTIMSRKTDRTQAIDRHVGQRIRWFRIQRNLSQEQLSQMLGISYQQLHKYETGSNAVSASKLYDIATALHVSAGDFFHHMDAPLLHMDWLDAHTGREPMLIAKYFARIPTSDQRHIIIALMRSMAEEKGLGGYPPLYHGEPIP